MHMRGSCPDCDDLHPVHCGGGGGGARNFDYIAIFLYCVFRSWCNLHMPLFLCVCVSACLRVCVRQNLVHEMAA